jgi:high frequency lysogenization protein
VRCVKNRVLALAGVMQGLRLARDCARDGSADEADLSASLASIFRIDADSVEAVYGSASLMRTGLETLLQQIAGGTQRDRSLGKMASTVLQIERQLQARPDLMKVLHDGIVEASRQREHFGVSHGNVIARLGDIYANSVSVLPLRVLVQGNPHQLQQEAIVAKIRACLLASVRSAVLWRQLRGSYWDFVLRRRALQNAAQHWLES